MFDLIFNYFSRMCEQDTLEWQTVKDRSKLHRTDNLSLEYIMSLNERKFATFLAKQKSFWPEKLHTACDSASLWTHCFLLPEKRRRLAQICYHAGPRLSHFCVFFKFLCLALERKGIERGNKEIEHWVDLGFMDEQVSSIPWNELVNVFFSIKRPLRVDLGLAVIFVEKKIPGFGILYYWFCFWHREYQECYTFLGNDIVQEDPVSILCDAEAASRALASSFSDKTRPYSNCFSNDTNAEMPEDMAWEFCMLPTTTDRILVSCQAHLDFLILSCLTKKTSLATTTPSSATTTSSLPLPLLRMRAIWTTVFTYYENCVTGILAILPFLPFHCPQLGENFETMLQFLMDSLEEEWPLLASQVSASRVSSSRPSQSSREGEDDKMKTLRQYGLPVALFALLHVVEEVEFRHKKRNVCTPPQAIRSWIFSRRIFRILGNTFAKQVLLSMDFMKRNVYSLKRVIAESLPNGYLELVGITFEFLASKDSVATTTDVSKKDVFSILHTTPTLKVMYWLWETRTRSGRHWLEEYSFCLEMIKTSVSLNQPFALLIFEKNLTRVFKLLPFYSEGWIFWNIIAKLFKLRHQYRGKPYKNSQIILTQIQDWFSFARKKKGKLVPFNAIFNSIVRKASLMDAYSYVDVTTTLGGRDSFFILAPKWYDRDLWECLTRLFPTLVLPTVAFTFLFSHPMCTDFDFSILVNELERAGCFPSLDEEMKNALNVDIPYKHTEIRRQIKPILGSHIQATYPTMSSLIRVVEILEEIEVCYSLPTLVIRDIVLREYHIWSLEAGRKVVQDLQTIIKSREK